MKNDSVRSIFFAQTIPINRFDELFALFFEYWLIRSDEYHASLRSAEQACLPAAYRPPTGRLPAAYRPPTGLELLNKKILISRIKDKIMIVLDSDKLYAVLINLQYIKNGSITGTSPMKSIIITGSTNVSLIADNILNALTRAHNEYRLEAEECFVSFYWRQWLSEDEYSKLVGPVNRNKKVEEVLREEANLKLDNQSKLDKIVRFMKIDQIQNYLNEFPQFNSITKLQPYRFKWDDLESEFSEVINSENENFKMSVYKNNKCRAVEG
uniref:DNA polymerase n=1 Tax=Ramaria rubella TaxID=113071 RepID=UPI00223704E1|nr:DNA polymerase [Ramaria rubella]UYR22229.1 DNA polymerase [Ramaria rubella]